MNARWGLVKDRKCLRCGGVIELQIDCYGEDIKCMICGTPYNDKVPDFILKEVGQFNGMRRVGVPRFKC